MKKTIFGLLTLAACAATGLTGVSAAQDARWKLVGGANQTPAEYRLTEKGDCDVAAVYGFVESTQSWVIWFDAGHELEGVNDDFEMEAGHGYWVFCRAG